MENYSFLIWVGSVVTGILGLIGLKEIIGKIIDRLFKKQDEQTAQHLTNHGKQIEFDIVAFQKMAERLEKVESKLEEMQEKYTSQAIKNERLSAENEHLKVDVTRLQKRNEELQSENKQQSVKIINLENSNKRLETEVKDLKDLVNSKLGNAAR